MVATTGAVPLLIAENAAMSPVPFPARPMPVVLLVHVYEGVPPVLTVVKDIAAVCSPLHITWLAGWSVCAVGLTVTVNVLEGPSQVTVPFSK